MTKHCSKTTKPSRGPDPSTVQGYAHQGVTSSRTMPPQVQAGPGMYHDQIQVQQWAATSATGVSPVEDSSSHDLYMAGYGYAPMVPKGVPTNGAFPMSSSPVTPASLACSTQDLGTMSEMNYSNLYNGNSCVIPSGLATDLTLQQAQAYGNNFDYAPSQCTPAAWSYQTPSTDGIVYSNHFATAEVPLEAQDTSACFAPAWPQMTYQNGDSSLQSGMAFASHSLSGSPLSAVDLSVSSSYSQNSFPGPEPDTPLSQAIQDGAWTANQDNGCYHGLSNEESATIWGLNDLVDNGDGSRLVEH